jgi:hypothetical protein
MITGHLVEEAAAAALVPVRKKQGLDETTARNGEWPQRERTHAFRRRFPL